MSLLIKGNELTKEVLHVITTIDLGGAEKQLLTLAQEQRKRGYNVEILFLKGLSQLEYYFETIGCNVVHKPSLIRALFYLRKRMLLVDITHAHLPRAELLCLFGSVLSRVGFVVSRHNAEPFFPRSPKLSPSLSRVVLSRSTRIVAISHTVREYLIQNQEVSKNQINKLSVIEYGVEIKRDRLKQRKFGEKFGKFRISTISRLVPQKDIGLQLKALSMLPLEIDWELTIVGVGPQRELLAKMSADLGISSRIEWRRDVFSIDEFLQDTDIFLLTSRYEGFGLVLLESMINGTAIIATKAAAILEVMGEEYRYLVRSGDFVDLRNKILEVMELNGNETFLSYYHARLERFDARKMESLMNAEYNKSSLRTL